MLIHLCIPLNIPCRRAHTRCREQSACTLTSKVCSRAHSCTSVLCARASLCHPLLAAPQLRQRRLSSQYCTRELHIRATGIMDSKLREADSLADDASGKKKSKFKNFKKFFVIKKRKEALPSLDKIGLKPSQSTSDVTFTESVHLDDDSEDETGSHMGGRALSHDSIFIPDVVQEPQRPGRVFSQENVSDRIRTLQLKLQGTIVMGPPPLRIPSKRTDDTGASSEDDGLPRSPPEISLIQEALSPSTASRFSDSYKRLSNLSLAGTGSEEEELIPSGPSSRPLSPVSQLVVRPASSRAVSPQRSESHISPSADFDTPPQFLTCLDNSAAKHRLSIKPRNQRTNKTRKPSVKSLSESLNDLSSTPEEVDESDRMEAVGALAWENTASSDQGVEDSTKTVTGISGLHDFRMPQISYTTTEVEFSNPASEKSAAIEVSNVTAVELHCERSELSGPFVLESEERVHSDLGDVTKGTPGGKDLFKVYSISPKNIHGSAIRTLQTERKLQPHIPSSCDGSFTKDTTSAQSLPASIIDNSTAVGDATALYISPTEGVSSLRDPSTATSDFAQQNSRRSSHKHVEHTLHAVSPRSPFTPTIPSPSFKVGSSFAIAEKIKSSQVQISPKREDGVSVGQPGSITENRPSVNELGALRKFSVSSAWERPKTGTFNIKGNPENRLSVKSPKSKSDIPTSGKETHKQDGEHISEYLEIQPGIKTQGPPLDTELRPEEKGAPVCVSQTITAAPAVDDSLVYPLCQSDSKDQNPFQVKLRSTSLSLRYRSESSRETKGAKRYSAEIKVEKEAYSPVTKDEPTQIKRTEVTAVSPLNEHGNPKAKSHENIEAKPPLPRKPVLQHKAAYANTADVENQDRNPKSTDSRSESKEAEKRPSFYKFAEKSALSPVTTAELLKGVDIPSEPTWITRVKQKQWGLSEQQPTLDEKFPTPERNTESGVQNRNKENMEVASKQPAETNTSKTTFSTSKTTSDEPSQESRNDLKETCQRAHTVSQPISATQPLFVAEKEEKSHHPRASPATSDRPSWMELAKKKSQAWNDMPQIIK
ncbi:hypothetical protein NDU88_006726 [Pleurodeles waltl]|uniref:DUF4592 domain-containing protein n=3 Tax=Pleurodeles waltl TaxID=8319 RepID=A0AAV7P063_PLEWA|nr:hypothetical protein NDU88_006726 [Pleurodeles waltl]